MNQQHLALHQNTHDDISSSTSSLSSSTDYNIVTHTAVRLLQNITTNATNSTVDDQDADQDEAWKRIMGIVVSNVLLFALIFGLSATVDSKNLKKQLTNKFAIGCGVIMQYLFMPVLGCISVCVFSQFGLTKSIAIALMVVTASPGGSYSNWWCSTFNADLALSVAMTTVSSLLSVIFLPFNLFFYSWIAFGVFKVNDTVDSSSIVKSLSFTALFQSLAVVLCAILLGLLAGYKYDTPSFHNFNHKLGSIAGIFLVIFSIVVVSGPKAQLGSLGWTFYIATTLPCLGGLILANICSRLVKLSPPEVMSIAIECCYQNTGIATSVAITMFSDKTERAQAVAVPLLYGIVSAITILIFSVFSWKMGWTKAPADENICKVITTSYEVDEMIQKNANDATNSNNNNNNHQDDYEQQLHGSEEGRVTDDITTTTKERERMNTYDSVTATTVSTCTPLRKDSNDESVDDLDIEDNIVDRSNDNNNNERVVVTVDSNEELSDDFVKLT